VVNDVVTNPSLEDTRRFYGAPGGRTIALVNGSSAAWPKGWQPHIPGLDVVFRSETSPLSAFLSDYVPGGWQLNGYLRSIRPRLLGVRLDKLNLDATRDFDDQIAVCVFNVGGDGREPSVIGGCIVY